MTVSPLICDVYAGDLGGKPDFSKLVSAGLPWCGVMLKATQGTYYDGGSWFQTYWPLAKTLAGRRYGTDWFRGAYCYIDLSRDPIAQADFYLKTIDRAGGWGDGDLWPVVDVESAHNPENATAQQVEDCVTPWATRVAAVTGRRPVLYGNIYLAERAVTSRMGCQLLWVARYTAMLPAEIYQRIGWTLETLFAWQYVGDSVGALDGYPHISPMGKVDISALTIAGGGDKAIDWVRDHLAA